MPQETTNDERQVLRDLSRARDRLTRYLALRDHSRFELRTKLAKSFPPEIIEKIMNEAESSGWLAPEEQIAERLAAQLERQNKSRRYIEGQLRRRRLPLTASDQQIELDKVRRLLERRFGSIKDLSFEERARAFRFLKYRGFDDRSIRQVFNEKS